MRGALRRLSILLVQAMALLVVLFAWTVARDEMKAEPLISLAERIERGKDIDPDYLLSMTERALALAGEARCESRSVKAGLTILLRRLDTLNAKKDPSEFVLALGQTRSYIDHALACTPTDGNLWLRRAMISLAEGRTMDLVYEDLKRSQHFAPAEANVLAGRFRVLNELHYAELKRAAPVMLADLKTICGKPQFMAKLPKVNPSLAIFLGQQATSSKQASIKDLKQKTFRLDQRRRVEAPGLWCGALFPA